MEYLKPMGKRDLFGIVLPGTIVISAIAYVLFGVLKLLDAPQVDLLSQELLLTVLFFVAAYLVGSILRLVAADQVDRESSRVLEGKWRKMLESGTRKSPPQPRAARSESNKTSNTSHKSRDWIWRAYQTYKAGLAQDSNVPATRDGFEAWLEQTYEKHKAKLSEGNDVSNVMDGFDDWLWWADDFPYCAWQNRKWQAQNLSDVLKFFRRNYRASMWSVGTASPKSFFNYCKLTVIKSNAGLADEVNMAEGLTRYLAGTVTALRASIRVLGVYLVFNLAFLLRSVVPQLRAVTWLPSTGWDHQELYLVCTVAILIAFWWIRREIVENFRAARLRETETVYHSFYLSSLKETDDD
jgi:hypothetical protein